MDLYCRVSQLAKQDYHQGKALRQGQFLDSFSDVGSVILELFS